MSTGIIIPFPTATRSTPRPKQRTERMTTREAVALFRNASGAHIPACLVEAAFERPGALCWLHDTKQAGIDEHAAATCTAPNMLYAAGFRIRIWARRSIAGIYGDAILVNRRNRTIAFRSFRIDCPLCLDKDEAIELALGDELAWRDDGFMSFERSA